MEILLVRGDRAVAPAAVLVESVSPRAASGSEHGRRASLDRVEILGEAEDGLSVVEADRSDVPATSMTIATGIQITANTIARMILAMRRARMRRSSCAGPGNFRNMFVHAPKGGDNGIKIIPIAEVGANDQFLGIKTATQADILAAHRVPPQLLGIVPAQGSAFGNPTDATAMFMHLEIWPILMALQEINDQVGVEAVRYQDRLLPVAAK
jgi:hypothetical protein